MLLRALLGQAVEIATQCISRRGRPARRQQRRRQLRIVQGDATKGVDEEAAHDKTALRIDAAVAAEVAADRREAREEAAVLRGNALQVPAVAAIRSKRACNEPGSLLTGDDRHPPLQSELSQNAA